MIRASLIALVALIPSLVLAAGISVGGTFRHTYNAAEAGNCGQPIAAVVWSDSYHAHQAYQHCTLKAHLWRVVTRTPTPRPSPTSTPIPWPTAVPTSTPVPSSDPVQYELQLMNSDRAAYGLAPYTLDSTQSDGTSSCAGSIGHSQAMAQSGSIWHTNPSYPAASFPNNICVPYYAGAGENVGESGSGNELNDLTILDSKMMAELGNPPNPSMCATVQNHACNIISRTYTQVGIGIVQSGGATWLTVDFIG